MLLRAKGAQVGHAGRLRRAGWQGLQAARAPARASSQPAGVGRAQRCGRPAAANPLQACLDWINSWEGSDGQLIYNSSAHIW